MEREVATGNAAVSAGNAVGVGRSVSGRRWAGGAAVSVGAPGAGGVEPAVVAVLGGAGTVEKFNRVKFGNEIRIRVV